MKNILCKALSLSLAVLPLAACQSFLEKAPLSAGTEAIFFKNPEQFEQAARALYDLPGWGNYRGGNETNAFGRMDQGADTHGFDSNGGGSAPENDNWWTFSNVRRCNILLQKASEYSGGEAEIAHSVGTAYFFRAFNYFTLLQRFGGVPIVDHVMDVSDEVVYGPRSSRYEVMAFIISDLEKAIPLLSREREISDADKGTISQEAAKAFYSRTLLYEATWEKYATPIYDFDGDGASMGAGKAKPADYPSVNDMLTRAKQYSGEVITEAETGTYELWNQCDSLSYYYLFNIDDGSGNIPNFKGAGKATNKEFIIYNKYHYGVRNGGINLTHTVISQYVAQISALFGESFLCRNGLPIRVSYTGSEADAQNNSDFKGYTSFSSEFVNRDYRFVGTAMHPDRLTWCSRPEDGRQLATLSQPYPTPIYPKPSYAYDPTDPAYTSKLAIFNPLIALNSTHNGFGSRKWLIEGAGRPTANQESADYPILRLAEVHLIYAEATCELGGGQISDDDLNFSINKNRARAGVAPLTNSLIANVWDAGWWDHTQNKTVVKKMNMLDEIRRERACELFGEGFRMDDLKRWGIAHINLRGQKLGRFIYGTAYMTAKANDAIYFGEPVYEPVTRPTRYGIYEQAGLDYGRAIANDAGNLLFSERDYLSPIPLTQIRLNPALTQNPGW